MYLPTHVFIRFFAINVANDIVEKNKDQKEAYYVYDAGIDAGIDSKFIIDFNELKRFVESFKLIKEEGSLDDAKDRLKFLRRMMDRNERLEQAVEDYELCAY